MGRKQAKKGKGTSSANAPLRQAADLIGDKWSLCIVGKLLSSVPKQGFNSLLRSLQPISSRTLSLKLQKLEDAGLVSRKILDARPIKVEYALTKKGTALSKPLKALGDWFKGVYRK